MTDYKPPPTTGDESRLSEHQIVQLLEPVRPSRIKKDFGGNSHLPYFDVTAHLIRVFGFGNFDTEVVDLQLIADRIYPYTPKNGKAYDAHDALYRATVRLTVKAPDGTVIATYMNASTGDATAQRSIGDAHDLALKSAISLATKRCAINLGDQFGLSLYNKGMKEKLVVGTLVDPRIKGARDVQEDVPESKSMGVDETRHGDADVDPSEEQQAQATKTLGHQPTGAKA